MTEFNKYIYEMRKGKVGPLVTLIVGGTNTVQLPESLLKFIPWFSQMESLNGMFVPYKYEDFMAVINFTMNPEYGLDIKYHTA